jgi:hypothetical protein
MATMNNLILGDLHGSIGGVTFYGKSGHQKARIKTQPTFKQSGNIVLSQNSLKLASATWSLLDVPTKALWQTFATTIFLPHGKLPVPPYHGFQALFACEKMWNELIYKQVGFIYNFDALAPVIPISTTILPFNSVPPLVGMNFQLQNAAGVMCPMTVTKAELRFDHHLKFKVTYTHPPPVGVFENTWTCYSNINFMWAVFASEAVPFMNAAFVNPIRYFLGTTGYIVNPPNTMSLSQSCTFILDCTGPISLNYSFPPVGSFIYLYFTIFDEHCNWSAQIPFCTSIVNAFTF